MARRPTRSQTRIFEALIAKLEPSLRKAFLAAVNDWRAGVDTKALIAALERMDVEAAISALNLDRAAFNEYMQVKTAAYVEAGTATVATINVTPTERLSIRFDMTNPAAERWIAENVGGRVTQITEEQVKSVRGTILAGYSQGQGPETIARDIAGRMKDGRRQGGIIGLSDPQSQYVMNMRERLRSGQASEMRKVLDGMTLRDKRFDPAIRKAIRTGKPLTDAQIEAMVVRYVDKLKAHRSVVVSRTETGQAVMSGRFDEWVIATEKLGYNQADIVKTWKHNKGGVAHFRADHLAMNNREVQGLYGTFDFPDGVQKLHALDGQGGAKHDASCGCGTDLRYRRRVM